MHKAKKTFVAILAAAPLLGFGSLATAHSDRGDRDNTRVYRTTNVVRVVDRDRDRDHFRYNRNFDRHDFRFGTSFRAFDPFFGSGYWHSYNNRQRMLLQRFLNSLTPAQREDLMDFLRTLTPYQRALLFDFLRSLNTNQRHNFGHHFYKFHDNNWNNWSRWHRGDNRVGQIPGWFGVYVR